jgi:hypothetical protein
MMPNHEVHEEHEGIDKLATRDIQNHKENFFVNFVLSVVK